MIDVSEYGFSDYGVFDDAISNLNTFFDHTNSISDVISECKSELNDSVFMGPISDNCQEIFSTLSGDFSNIQGDLATLSNYLGETSTNYQSGDSSASNTITGNNGTMSATLVTGSANPNSGNVDTSKYSSNPSAGFNVTSGNTTYNLNSSDKDLIYAIVSAESDKSYDDALAVASVILNRCEAPNWVSSHGTNPVSQATAPNQFVVYQSGSYKQYTNGNAPDTVQQAVDDALNGVRNNEYLSFRSNGTSGYSSNMITSTGNRYK